MRKDRPSSARSVIVAGNHHPPLRVTTNVVTIISATNISIITYAGDGKWKQQEDIYNPLRFVQASIKWCRKAQELGTLDKEAAEWLAKFGGAPA